MPLAVALLLWCAIPQRLLGDVSHPWWEVKSQHFTLYTDAEPRRGAEILLSLEYFRALFARLAPSLELSSPAPTKLFVFRDEESYAPYRTVQGRGAQWVLGQFISTHDGNYITLNAGEMRAGAFTVIYHEFVHYLARNNFPYMPRWLHEGLAEYYSTFSVRDGVAYLGHPVQRHLRWLERGGTSGLDSIISVQGLDRHDGEAVGEFYAVSWALVHYLFSGGEERSDQLADFLFALESREEPLEAFEQAFAARVGRIEDELQAYLQQGEFAVATVDVDRLSVSTMIPVAEMSAADALWHLGDLLAHTGRSQQAEQHFHQALDLEPQHPGAHMGLAFVRDLGGRLEEAELLYRDGLSYGAQDAHSHLLYGRHLLAMTGRANAEAGEDPGAESRSAIAQRSMDHLAKAIGAEPSFAEPRVQFGKAFLVSGQQEDTALQHLEKAAAMLPARPEVEVLLVHAYLKAGKIGAARGRLNGPLSFRLDPERLVRLEQEVERAEVVLAYQDAHQAGRLEEAAQLLDQAISLTPEGTAREAMESSLLRLQEVLRSKGG